METNKQPILSIIVPVYNVEKYLPKCIESILNQTFNDFEVILVDDGSTDKSGELCDDYQELDSRLQVIHQKNVGLGGARNVGISLSRGRYIGFVDSDDTIHPQMYTILLNEVEQSQSEIGICRYQCYAEGRPPKMLNISTYETREMQTEEALRQLLKGQLYRHSVCNKVFKRELVKTVLFPVGKIYEDNFFTYRAIAQAHKVKYVHLTLYYYLQREGSIVHRSFSEKNLEILNAGEDIIQFINKQYPNLQMDAECAYALRFFDIMNTLLVEENTDQVILQNLKQRIRKQKSSLKENTMLTKKQQILIQIFSYSPKVYMYIIKHLA
ncbi:glycosyltransferase family 2 protein [Niameybacter massiliensis]|uniref:glycosyltransferase family 2 protein n=1 Tax=Niameybacter massiliensis TaxID=1658108 RepID=UPI0006B5FCFB|nr:glycosyltransferase [Niameybacter massiliensis]